LGQLVHHLGELGEMWPEACWFRRPVANQLLRYRVTL
jgi:hypothetical protein